MIRSYRLSKIGSISSKWGAWVAPGSRVAIPNIENFRSLSTGSVDSKDNEEKLLQFKREVFTEKRLEYLSSVKKGDEWFPLEWMSPEDRKLVLKWWLEDSIGEEYVDDVFEIFEPEQLEKIVDGCKGTFDGRAVLEVLSRLQEYSIVDPSTDLEAFIQKQIIERERKSHAIKRLGKVLRAQKFRATGISQSPDRISEASISNLVAPEGSDEDNETNVNRNITQSISGGKRNADPLDSSSKITMAEMHTDLFYTEHEAVYAIHKSLVILYFSHCTLTFIYVISKLGSIPLTRYQHNLRAQARRCVSLRYGR